MVNVSIHFHYSLYKKVETVSRLVIARGFNAPSDVTNDVNRLVIKGRDRDLH